LCLVESSRSWLGGKEIFRKKSSCMSLHLPLGMKLCFLWAECPIMILAPHAGRFVLDSRWHPLTVPLAQ
jgi:hypothetical protein